MSAFSKFVAEDIIDRIYEGQTIKHICTLPGYPDYREVRAWCRNYPEFKQAYDEALLASADVFASDELQLARDTIEIKLISAPEVQARKMLSDSLRWHARTRNPNAYGDKAQLQHEHRGLKLENLTDAELAAVVARGTGSAAAPISAQGPA